MTDVPEPAALHVDPDRGRRWRMARAIGGAALALATCGCDGGGSVDGGALVEVIDDGHDATADGGTDGGAPPPDGGGT